MFESWHEFYAGDLQSLWSLLVAPALFLWVLVLGAGLRGPGADGASGNAAFVRVWCVVFAIETLLDPIATGPLVTSLGWGGLAGQAVMVAFVVLGDFRVLWLVLRLGAPASRPALRAALVSLAIPTLAWASNAGLSAAFGPLPGQVLWLLHEITFGCVAVALLRAWLPTRALDAGTAGFLQDVLLYAASYYVLWAACDVLVLAGVDAGWGLRAIPNQLYYAFTVPFVWWRFHSSRQVASRTSVQASR